MKSITKRNILFIITAIIVFYTFLYLRDSSGTNEDGDVSKTYDIPIIFENELDKKIPKLPTSSNQLNTNFETLKIRLGYYLSGPSDSWRSVAESIFELNNVSDVDFYKDLTSDNNLIGVKNGKIVFWGKYGISSYTLVKDLLIDNALTIEPAIYDLPQKYSSWKSYVWKLNNGYMVVVVIGPYNRNFYDQTVFSVAYVTDLTFFPYVN